MGANDDCTYQGLDAYERFVLCLHAGWLVTKQGLFCECGWWIKTVGEIRQREFAVPSHCKGCGQSRPTLEKEIAKMKYEIQGRQNGVVVMRYDADGERQAIGRFANKDEAKKAIKQLKATGQYDKRRLETKAD